MRILFVTKFFPYPLDTGGTIRNFNLLRELSKKDDVYLFALSPRSELPRDYHPLDEFCRGIRVFPVGKSFPHKLCKLAEGVLGPRPHEVACNRNRKIRAALRSSIIEWNVDLICAEELAVTGNIDFEEGKPVVLDAHNCEGPRLSQLAPLQKSIISRIFYRMQATKAAGWERRVARKAAGIFSMSESDADYFRPLNKKVYVVPNGAGQVVSRTHIAEPLILFTGRLDYPPNHDGLLFFMEKVLPLVRAEIPSARLVIIGRKPSARLLRCRSSYLEILTKVDDLSAFLSRAAVSVAPLRAGSGTRLKILEAFAAGVPVVATAIGAEGLKVKNDIHLLIRDDEKEFARAVVRLLTDRSLCQSVTDEARRLVEREYFWSNIAEAAHRAFVDIFEGGGPQS